MVEGLKRLRRRLTREIPASVRAETRKAMEVSADEIVALAKAWVPVASGDLRDSIGWTWGDPPSGALVLGSSRPVGNGERITIYAGSREAYYVRWQEFGTVNMTASPFFFPAYRQLKRRAKGRVTRALNKAIKASKR